MKLSIIIPVYKAEATLRRCVGSILSQPFKDYELLLVDDGSPDNSGAVAEELAARDGRVKVHHKQNGGPADARNHGLDRAKGEYIIFVDSDDALAPDTLMPLMERIGRHPEYDILEYSFMERIGHPDERFFNLGEHVCTDPAVWLANGGFHHCWVWNKIFKRRLFDGTRFPGLKFAEDLWLMGELMKKKPMMATTSHGTYLYYWNGNGITATMPCYIDLLRGQLNIIKQLGIDTRRKEWHGLYMEMFDIQLYVYALTGKIMLTPQRVIPRKYNGKIQGLVKSLMLDILGLKGACKAFKKLRI